MAKRGRKPTRAEPPPSALRAEREAKLAERARAAAAFDAMVRARPLKPPPGEIPLRRATASELALAADKRAGIVGERFRLDSFE